MAKKNGQRGGMEQTGGFLVKKEKSGGGGAGGFFGNKWYKLGGFLEKKWSRRGFVRNGTIWGFLWNKNMDFLVYRTQQTGYCEIQFTKLSLEIAELKDKAVAARQRCALCRHSPNGVALERF